MAKFGKFVIVSRRDMEAMDELREEIFINYDHIVSVKPIQMVTEEAVVKGFWVRVINGKKYRAISIPDDIVF